MTFVTGLLTVCFVLLLPFGPTGAAALLLLLCALLLLLLACIPAPDVRLSVMERVEASYMKGSW
jgi:hypothetical protein